MLKSARILCTQFRKMSGIAGPHMALANGGRKGAPAYKFGPGNLFTLELFDRLWDQYRQRVSYVQTYESVTKQHGATFFNDHIALRTIAVQRPHVGISSISRVFEALGYRAAETYQFEDKHLSALYFEPPYPQMPKLFISELRSWELGERSRTAIHNTLKSYCNCLTDDLLAEINSVRAGATPRSGLLEDVLSLMQKLPWLPPDVEDVKALNEESQYGAWVLVHGFNVNHFTALINSHGVESLATIDKTADALRVAGVPMKKEIEGAAGTNLRQTATEAVVESVSVLEKGQATKVPWTYAYFELAQRDPYKDASGAERRYEGFMSGQATSLFDMTNLAHATGGAGAR